MLKLNNMKKTALQQYIDEIKEIQSKVPEASKLLYQAFIDKAQDYEELEKSYAQEVAQRALENAYKNAELIYKNGQWDVGYKSITDPKNIQL